MKFFFEFNTIRSLFSSIYCVSKMTEPVKIVTHSGIFHADDALACGLLRILPRYQNAKIIRTRDPNLISQGDIVVDVGTIYDPKTFRFDHHQLSFNHSMNSLDERKKWKVRLSSAGLVYFHFGREIIKYLNENTHLLRPDTNNENISSEPLDENTLESIFDKVYDSFLLEIDAIDNGVNTHECNHQPIYTISTHLSKRVQSLAPFFREKSNDEILMARFEKAIELTTFEFKQTVARYLLEWLPVKNIVEQVFQKRFEMHPSGQILIFDEFFVSAVSHLIDIEKRLQLEGTILFIIFPNTDNTYRVKAIAQEADSFNLRHPLNWKGLRDEELSEAVGCSGCIFVHVNGFIGGAKSLESALQMASLSLPEKNENAAKRLKNN